MEIRESPETNRILANRFGVHHSVIGKIKTNQIWRTTMNNQVLTVQSDAILTPRPIEFSAEQVELIKTTIAKGSSDDELDLFIATCRRTGLDPFLRQIYAVKRYDASENKSVMAIQVGIDGQRLIAERTGLYDGQDPVEFLDENGQWSEVWTGAGDHPVAARCAVYRKDWSTGRKATATVRFQSYAQTYKKNNSTFLMPTWAKMPDVMLGKCAESLALRRAFPAEMSAIAALAGSTYDPAAEADEEIAPEHVEEPDAVEGAFTVVDEGDNEKPDTTDADPPATDTACPEGGEHLPQYSEDLTVMACSKCGTALEGPEENA